MKCQFCNQDLVQNQTKSATRCMNHKMDINYFPSFTGYTIYNRGNNYLSSFYIQNYVDKNQCVIEYYGSYYHNFENPVRIVLDFIPDWDPDTDLEIKIKSMATFS